MAHVGAQENASHVCVVRLEGGYGDEGGHVAVLFHLPEVDVALQAVFSVLYYHLTRKEDTRLFPTQSNEPSLATVTLATETSSSGMS